MWCRKRHWIDPSVAFGATSRVVEKSVNSVSAFGAKSSVHFLSPPFPSEPATLGFAGAPFGGARK